MDDDDEPLGSCFPISEREWVVNNEGTASTRNAVVPSKSFDVKCSRHTLNVIVAGVTGMPSYPQASSHRRAMVGSRGILYSCTRCRRAM